MAKWQIRTTVNYTGGYQQETNISEMDSDTEPTWEQVRIAGDDVRLLDDGGGDDTITIYDFILTFNDEEVDGHITVQRLDA